jgi:ABC-2 type transport system permease protein
MNLKSEYIINNYGKTSGNSDIQIYYRYYAYVAFAVLILGITSVMLSFNNLDLRRRNLASPIKNINYNMQIILGSLVFTILVWFVITLISIFIYGLEVVTSKSILLVLNAFVVSFAALSLSFFVGNFIKSKGAQSAVATILSLGLCFLSGVFVPQEFMSSSVLKISSFTPTYWYVKAVNDIGELTVFSSENILPIVYSMLIQLGFALAILLISLILVRQKRTSSQ